MTLVARLFKKTQSTSAKASLWTLLGFGSSKVIQLLSNLVLTRILFPEAFGLMVIVTSVLIGLALFSDIGLKPAIVQHPRGTEPTFLNTAWTVQVIRGFILFAVACAIAYPMAVFYKQPILTWLICTCASTAIIHGFTSISMALVERNMDLKRLTILAMASQLVSVVVMIVLAWIFKSVWALVAGNIVGSVFTLIMTHIYLTPHKHQFMLHSQSWQEMKNFGRWIMASTFFTYLGGHGMKMIEAGFVSLDTVAFLQIATTLALSLREIVVSLLSKILFPTLSRIYRDSPELFVVVFRRYAIKLLVFPLLGYGFLTLLSTPIIALLYDERYDSSKHYLALYALAGIFAVITAVYENALLAQGRSKDAFRITSSNAVMQIGALVAGFWLAGVIGMVAGAVMASFCNYCYAVYIAWQRKMLLGRIDLVYLTAALLIVVASVGVNFPQLWSLFLH